LLDPENVNAHRGVPTVWRCCSTLAANHLKLPLLRMVGRGVPAMPRSNDQSFLDMGVQVRHPGQTEMSPIGTLASFEASLHQRPHRRGNG